MKRKLFLMLVFCLSLTLLAGGDAFARVKKPKMYRPKTHHSRSTQHHSTSRRNKSKQTVSPFQRCDSYDGCMMRKPSYRGNSRRVPPSAIPNHY